MGCPNKINKFIFVKTKVHTPFGHKAYLCFTHTQYLVLVAASWEISSLPKRGLKMKILSTELLYFMLQFPYTK